jgi:2-haloalkanoic acid dehalogenase type II
MPFDLTQYKLLSFDIYGTLIDWESGIFTALTPLVSQLPSSSPYISSSPAETRKLLLRAFSAHERALQAEQPKLPYNQLLTETYTRLATTLGVEASDEDARKFGQSVGSYPAFPDTVAAMQELGKHYKLVALSNIDNTSFARTLSGPLNGVRFDAIYMAEDIGSYKPSLENFEYLIKVAREAFGVRKEEILHVAQSLTHDHVPAKEIGLSPGVWIARGGADGKGSAIGGEYEALKGEGRIELGAVYSTLGEMAEDVERAFAGEKEE